MHVGKSSASSGLLLTVVYKVDFAISAEGFRLKRHSAKYLEVSIVLESPDQNTLTIMFQHGMVLRQIGQSTCTKRLGINRLRNRDNVDVPASGTVISTSPAICCSPLEAHVQGPPQPVCQLRDCNSDRHHLKITTCRVTQGAWTDWYGRLAASGPRRINLR